MTWGCKTANVDYSLDVYGRQKKEKTSMNSKFSGERKGGQKHKVLETLGYQNWVFLYIDPSQF